MQKPANRKKIAVADYKAMFKFILPGKSDYIGLRNVIENKFADNAIQLNIARTFADCLESIETTGSVKLNIQQMIARPVLSMMIMVGKIHAARVFATEFANKWGAEKMIDPYTMLMSTNEDIELLDVIDEPWRDYQFYPRGHKTTFILMCGLADRFGVEMNSVALWLRSLPVNIVYLRDFNRNLYLGGVRSIGDLDASIERISNDLASAGTERTIVMGTSGGVYGALLFSHLLKAQGTICFAGPTALKEGLQEAAERPFYARVQSQIDAGNLLEIDLRQCYATNNIPVRYFYAENYAFDAAQVETLEGLSNVSIEPLRNFDRHVVIGEIVRRGFLPDILRDAADVTLQGLNRSGTIVS